MITSTLTKTITPHPFASILTKTIYTPPEYSSTLHQDHRNEKRIPGLSLPYVCPFARKSTIMVQISAIAPVYCTPWTLCLLSPIWRPIYCCPRVSLWDVSLPHPFLPRYALDCKTISPCRDPFVKLPSGDSNRPASPPLAANCVYSTTPCCPLFSCIFDKCICSLFSSSHHNLLPSSTGLFECLFSF